MDICSLGAACVVNESDQYGLARATCQRVVDDNAASNEQGEDYGEMPIACALGLTALPAPPSEDGSCAEGVLEQDVGGFPGLVIAAWDTRCREVAGKMTGGDTCLHGTHADATNRAKFLSKDGSASVIVGNDLLLQLDRKNQVVTIAGFGALIQFDSEQMLLVAPDGKSQIVMKGGIIQLIGNVVLGNPRSGAVAPVAIGPTPGVVSTSVVACV